VAKSAIETGYAAGDIDLGKIKAKAERIAGIKEKILS